MGNDVKTAKRWYWLVYVVILLVITVVASEVVALFLVPPWPARDLRPVSAAAIRNGLASVMSPSWPQLIPVYNDWAMRDRARSFERPPGVRFRSVIVGDSFVEGYFVSSPFPTRVERLWSDQGHADMEAINLGVTATGPRQYYYRTRDVALQLKPDAIVLVVYAGNDFISTPFHRFALPPLIDELPIPSVLGTIAPRTTWFAVDRLGLSEIGRSNKDIPGEFSNLNKWVQMPAEQRLNLIVQHMHKYYYPNIGKDVMREIFSRGNGRLWTAFEQHAIDPEFAVGWLFATMVDWETGKWDVPHDAAEADKMAGGPMVEETLSWIVATHQIAKDKGVRLIVALAPVGVVDPSFVEFWRPWPRYFSYSLSSDARHRHLAALLSQQGIPLIDLRQDLAGMPHTYRLIDGHWTEHGTDIVAGRIGRELLTRSP